MADGAAPEEGENGVHRIGFHLPWDRLPRESDEAWQAFVEYRDMGLSRTAQRVADIVGKSVSHIHAYSSRFQWRRRCHMYEQHLDAHRQAEHEKAVRDMARRHIVASGFLLRTAVEAIKLADPKDITVRDAIAMFRAAVPTERQGRAAEQAPMGRGGMQLMQEQQEEVDEDDMELGDLDELG